MDLLLGDPIGGLPQRINELDADFLPGIQALQGEGYVPSGQGRVCVELEGYDAVQLGYR